MCSTFCTSLYSNFAGIIKEIQFVNCLDGSIQCIATLLRYFSMKDIHVKYNEIKMKYELIVFFDKLLSISVLKTLSMQNMAVL